jgi:hypothetical protein
MALPPSVAFEAQYTSCGSIVKVQVRQTFVLCRKQAQIDQWLAFVGQSENPPKMIEFRIPNPLEGRLC